MKVTDEKFSDKELARLHWELENGTGNYSPDDGLKVVEELQSLRIIDIAHTLKYAEEAGAACEEMKHGIEVVIIEIEKKAKRVVNKYSDDELSFSSGLYESITIIENHLSKYLDE